MPIQAIAQSGIKDYRVMDARNKAGEAPGAVSTGDMVSLGREKSTIKKIGEAIIDFPVKILEVGVGTTMGTAYAAKNVIPGGLEGLREGMTDYKGDHRQGLFTASTIGEFTLGGACAGFSMGGPVTSAVGAGIGFLSGLVVRGIESLTHADDEVVNKVQAHVDKALADNTGGTAIQVATRNAVEGSLEGSVTGVTTGWDLGYRFGKGLVAGLKGAADGAKEAIFGK